MEKQKLIQLVKKKEAAEKKKNEMIRAERKLKAEIKSLKARTKKNIVTEAKKVLNSPGAKTAKKKAKSFFKGLQDFAERIDA